MSERDQLYERDQLAMSVACEVPDWFKHEPPGDRPKPPPLFEEVSGPEPEGYPESAAWRQRDAYSRACVAYGRQNNLARIAQWRYAVADAMLAERQVDRS